MDTLYITAPGLGGLDIQSAVNQVEMQGYGIDIVSINGDVVTLSVLDPFNDQAQEITAVQNGFVSRIGVYPAVAPGNVSGGGGTVSPTLSNFLEPLINAIKSAWETIKSVLSNIGSQALGWLKAILVIAVLILIFVIVRDVKTVIG